MIMNNTWWIKPELEIDGHAIDGKQAQRKVITEDRRRTDHTENTKNPLNNSNKWGLGFCNRGSLVLYNKRRLSTRANEVVLHAWRP